MVAVTPLLWIATAGGLGAGLGLWALATRLPVLARPRLAGRIAPFLVDVSAEARRLQQPVGVDPTRVLDIAAAPLLDPFQRWFGALLGGGARSAVLLARAGRDWSVEAYRLRQLLWAVAGLAAGAAVGALAALHGSPAALVAGPLVGATAGPLLRDRLLVLEGDRRARRIEGELPTVLEFLALSLSAGESVRDALHRVAAVGSGLLPVLLQRVVDQTSVGVPLGAALSGLADGMAIPRLTRCVAHVTAAIDRGSPLADVLRVQAAEAREAARRDLIEAAGRKEIAMLVPLVFLILPVTVAFAVYPGVLALQTRL